MIQNTITLSSNYPVGKKSASKIFYLTQPFPKQIFYITQMIGSMPLFLSLQMLNAFKSPVIKPCCGLNNTLLMFLNGKIGQDTMLTNPMILPNHKLRKIMLSTGSSLSPVFQHTSTTMSILNLHLLMVLHLPPIPFSLITKKLNMKTF